MQKLNKEENDRETEEKMNGRNYIITEREREGVEKERKRNV